MRRWRERLDEGIRYHEFVQYAFESQWQALRAACHERGIMLIGDVPIFVAHDSADVWGDPELFYLDEHGQPSVVAGVPPDYFSATGQLWGNPALPVGSPCGRRLCVVGSRLRFLLDRVDVIRIDHFRGFEAYWEIPAGSKPRRPGRWVPGPGTSLFRGHPPAARVASLDRRRPGVDHPRRRRPARRFRPTGNAGPSVRLQRPTRAPTRTCPIALSPHCVVYTGTHDNDTTKGWFTSTEVATTQSLENVEAERAFARRYLANATETRSTGT